MERFTEITRRALSQFITDSINERLRQALGDGNVLAQPVAVAQQAVAQAVPDLGADKDDKGTVTTEEEIEAFHIVKAILREAVDLKRVVMRDTASYCGVLLDDNNRKPLVRFRFGDTKKFLVLLNDKKEEERIPISDLNEIFQHADRIKLAVGFYAGAK